jgi:23S rRNA (guanosine2251-2'-O)-methyltransferase
MSEMIFGLRAVIEAVEAGKDIDKILLRKGLQSELANELFATIRGLNIPVQTVPEERLMRITRKNHQGVIAFLSAITYTPLSELVPSLYEAGKLPFLVLLDGITDVRNFGAIARTCVCAGVDGLIIPAQGSVSVQGDAVKTSAGALLSLPVCKERNIYQTLNYLKGSGFTLIAATEKAAHSYTEIDYRNPICLLMGAEDVGIAPEHLKLCDSLAGIPIQGSIASLNVSVAAGIFIYEALKQRTNP